MNAHVSREIGVRQIVLLGRCKYSPLKKHHTIIDVTRAVDFIQKFKDSIIGIMTLRGFQNCFKVFVQRLQPELRWCFCSCIWEENNCIHPDVCNHSPLKKHPTNIDVTGAVDVVRRPCTAPCKNYGQKNWEKVSQCHHWKRLKSALLRAHKSTFRPWSRFFLI